MLARRPACLLPVFEVYNKVADSGDVVIQKQGFSIVGTREPAFAMPLSPVCPSFHTMVQVPESYRNQILLVGRHQEVRRFVSPGLHHVKSVGSHCGMLHNTYVDGDLLGQIPDGGSMVKQRRCWSMVRPQLDDGRAFEQGYLRPCWSLYRGCE